jgi:tectonin beta-propeller repeat-containing protein 1
LGATKLLDISIQPWLDVGGSTVVAWAVATNGEVVVRQGVTRDCPEGTVWTHVASDVLFQVRVQFQYFFYEVQ